MMEEKKIPTVCLFSRVSEKQWAADAPDSAMARELIALPKRATSGAAGYDFVSPVAVTVAPGETTLIPTGIRAEIAPGWVLMLFPRSSLGFKHRLMLCNTVGVIDSDYFHAENEGHIMVKLFNAGDHAASISAGERFCQGVLLPYGLAADDCADAARRGGFGSTGSK